MSVDKRCQIESRLMGERNDKAADSQIRSYRSNAVYRRTNVEVTVCAQDLCDGSPRADRLQTEILARAQLRHPHVVFFFGASILPDACLILNEVLPGGSLAGLYARQRAKPPLLGRPWRAKRAQALEWALGLARAMSYMHMSDPLVVHGGLRPDRLLLTASGVLKVSGFADCSLGPPHPPAPPSPPPSADAPPAPYCALDHGRATQGGDGAWDGYLAPELLPHAPSHQAAGRSGGQGTPASDVYAAGGCMWFMRTGRQPCPPAPAKRGAGGASGADAVEWAGLAEVIVAAWAADAAARPSGEVLVSQLEALRDQAACCLPVAAGCCAVHQA